MTYMDLNLSDPIYLTVTEPVRNIPFDVIRYLSLGALILGVAVVIFLLVHYFVETLKEART